MTLLLPPAGCRENVKEEKKKEEEEEKKCCPDFSRTEMTRNLMFATAHHCCLARFSVRMLCIERIRKSIC